MTSRSIIILGQIVKAELVLLIMHTTNAKVLLAEFITIPFLKSTRRLKKFNWA